MDGHAQVLADKTVVLATNQLQFVSMADLVVVMRGGTAVEVGSYPELMNAGGVFAALMREAQVGEMLPVVDAGDASDPPALSRQLLPQNGLSWLQIKLPVHPVGQLWSWNAVSVFPLPASNCRTQLACSCLLILDLS